MESHAGHAAPVLQSGAGVGVFAIVGFEPSHHARMNPGQQFFALMGVHPVEPTRSLETDPVRFLQSATGYFAEQLLKGLRRVGHPRRGFDVHALLGLLGRSCF